MPDFLMPSKQEIVANLRHNWGEWTERMKVLTKCDQTDETGVIADIDIINVERITFLNMLKLAKD